MSLVARKALKASTITSNLQSANSYLEQMRTKNAMNMCIISIRRVLILPLAVLPPEFHGQPLPALSM
jgi:hypothetical protein